MAYRTRARRQLADQEELEAVTRATEDQRNHLMRRDRDAFIRLVSEEERTMALADNKFLRLDTPIDTAIAQLEAAHGSHNVYQNSGPAPTEPIIELEDTPLDLDMLRPCVEPLKCIDERELRLWLASNSVLPLLEAFREEWLDDETKRATITTVLPLSQRPWQVEATLISNLSLNFLHVTATRGADLPVRLEHIHWPVMYSISRFVYGFVCSNKQQFAARVHNDALSGPMLHVLATHAILTAYADLVENSRGFFAKLLVSPLAVPITSIARRAWDRKLKLAMFGSLREVNTANVLATAMVQYARELRVPGPLSASGTRVGDMQKTGLSHVVQEDLEDRFAYEYEQYEAYRDEENSKEPSEEVAGVTELADMELGDHPEEAELSEHESQDFDSEMREQEAEVPDQDLCGTNLWISTSHNDSESAMDWQPEPPSQTVQKANEKREAFDVKEELAFLLRYRELEGERLVQQAAVDAAKIEEKHYYRPAQQDLWSALAQVLPFRGPAECIHWYYHNKLRTQFTWDKFDNILHGTEKADREPMYTDEEFDSETRLTADTDLAAGNMLGLSIRLKKEQRLREDAQRQMDLMQRRLDQATGETSPGDEIGLTKSETGATDDDRAVSLEEDLQVKHLAETLAKPRAKVEALEAKLEEAQLNNLNIVHDLHVSETARYQAIQRVQDMSAKLQDSAKKQRDLEDATKDLRASKQSIFRSLARNATKVGEARFKKEAFEAAGNQQQAAGAKDVAELIRTTAIASDNILDNLHVLQQELDKDVAIARGDAYPTISDLVSAAIVNRSHLADFQPLQHASSATAAPGDHGNSDHNAPTRSLPWAEDPRMTESEGSERRFDPNKRTKYPGLPPYAQQPGRVPDWRKDLHRR